jgi:hypothetical protein
MTGEREKLVPLKTLGDWTVSEGEPDIRGWDVRTVSGKQLGNVQDLLIDIEVGEVLFLDMDLPGTDRHTFVPIGVVRLDRGRRVVLMDSADLPASNLARGERPASPPGQIIGGGSEPRSVRYSLLDREVAIDRPTLTDDASPPSAVIRGGSRGHAAEGTRGERRRIERMSTDL